MKIKFEKKTHTYVVNGDIASISVTGLLAKHGLAPNYSNVDESTLKAKATRGTEIHKDLESVLNVANYEAKTIEGADFNEWVEKNVDCAVGEQMLAFDYDGMIICGTADVMGYLQNGKLFIGDHKTTSAFHEEYVRWQVSLLDYFARNLNGESVNGNKINWKGADEFYCFWYHDEKMTVKELKKVDDLEIERLLACEYHNEIYTRPELVVETDLTEMVNNAEMVLAEINKKQKEAEENAKRLRALIMEEMERQGIKSWETDKVKITYVAPQDRIGIDSNKVKKEYPNVFNECQKLTKVGASVRITIKGDEDD